MFNKLTATILAALILSVTATDIYSVETAPSDAKPPHHHHEFSSVHPGLYHKNSSVQWIWAMLSLDHITLQGNENILDIGSADGKISAYLSKKIPEGTVYGVDVNKRAVKFANRRYPEGQYPNLSFETLDTQDMPFEENFDVVTAFLCLNWVHDVQAAVNQIAKALKPGGTALITVPKRGDEKAREAWIAMLSDAKWKPYLHLFEYQNAYSVEDYHHFFANADLYPEITDVSKTSVVFHDKFEFSKWILALNPRLREMPPHLLHELNQKRTDFVKSLFPQAGDRRIYAFPEKITFVVRKHIYTIQEDEQE